MTEFRDLHRINSTLCVWSCLDLLQNFLIALSRERCCCSSDDMQQNSKSPNITPFIIVFLKNLRWNIVWSSDNLVRSSLFQFRFHTLFPLEWKTKVNEHDLIIIRSAEKEVLSFQISMTDLLEVQVLDSLDHLNKDVSSFIFRETSELINSVEKLTALAQTE